MRFPLFVARRYLFSHKTRNVINIISGISVGGVAIGTMALIVVLSVFNGFDSLVKSLFNTFDPDMKIEVAEGKTFEPDSVMIARLNALDNVLHISEVLEEQALIEYREKQDIVTIKGVDQNFNHVTDIESSIVTGNYNLWQGEKRFALAGFGVASKLSMSVHFFHPMNIYAARRKATVDLMNPANDFISQPIYPAGIFSIQKEIDENFVLLPLDFTRNLLEYDKEASALELKINPELNERQLSQLQAKIQAIAGNGFTVKNRFQQQEMLYKIMQGEKWAIFLILSFILVIASFNNVGSLTMLIIDKKADINILRSMGANQRSIKHIFLFEGMMISGVGAVIGLVLGTIFCLAQIWGGFIPFPDEGFMIQDYPLEMQWPDFVAIFLTVNLIGFIAAWFPSTFAIKKQLTS